MSRRQDGAAPTGAANRVGRLTTTNSGSRSIGFEIFLKTFLAADAVVEERELDGPGVIERSFSTCGDYTAHCVMSDGSSSPACEFAVCDLSFELSVREVTPHEPWEISFASCNLKVIYVYLSSAANPYGRYHVLVSEQDREQGQVTVPAGLLQAEDAGVVRVRLFGENRYGRLHRQKTITVVNREP